ncbi:restriction endonuclease [Capnocytophaga sp. oral taxon 323]|uniref:5-methylcytosine restriction system specificity protein McrC n=1 Tax=Capnocytophaga sp. oral taxon 323 TaxID=1705617 RepID=UPI0006AF1281|nr:restriction endonuclease [Capnocytophaga sp. oral taxon 323]ALC96523.1 restriction endonuclease [Capnocytophaga sp. oral taxon 323]
MKITLLEHQPYSIKKEEESIYFEAIPKICPYVLKKDKWGNPIYPFEISRTNEEEVCLQAGYYVGALWLVKHHKFVYIEPKMNKKQIVEGLLTQEEEWAEIDYLKMLLSITVLDPKHTQNLIKIYWDEPLIAIEQQKDTLTPFLMVQFLLLLKRIVRKGLKKSYYTVEENLNNRIKGKIQLDKHLKQNVFKNKLTAHVCRYQEFGMDSLENRFLKKVLQFIISFKNTHSNYFAGNDESIRELITYCRPHFELISEELNVENLKKITTNPFFKEYEEAIRIGKQILKRFSYNITETTQQKVAIPPFWIDMPKLFELYVYKKLQEQFGSRGEVYYHFTGDYTELDFLLNTPEYKMVIDAKYKTVYEDSRVIDDIRQVSAYARLERVYKALKIDGDRLIDCLIIYPSFEQNTDLNIANKKEIHQYRNIYKLSVSVPLIINN